MARDFSVRAYPVKVDVSRRDDVECMVKFAVEKVNRIDILVNNAGILGPIGPLHVSDPNTWVETVHINLIGTFLCCRAVLPFLIEQGKGKIINLSGGGAASPRPFFSAYASSKAAVVRLTENLAEEVERFNIQVNAIAPGSVNTRLLDEVLAAGDLAGQREKQRAEKQKETGGISPEMAAALAVFLASDESDGLSGRLISAVWDDWAKLSRRIPEIMSGDLFTLRRIVT
jgi:NAD(P)-dependent dehydrogenase (short-subunit alcohol dehydrogenase family)